MHEINETLNDITGRLSDDLQLAQQALAISNTNSRITMEIFLVRDRALIDKLLATRSENSEAISALLARIRSSCKSEEEKDLLAAVEETRQAYVESYVRALHLLIDEKKHDAAGTVMVNETLPLLLKYRDTWNKFVEFHENEVDTAARQAQVDYVRTRRVGLSLTILAVAVALLIAIFTTRDTYREIAARIAAQNEVSKLNANLEKRVMQRTLELTDANQQLAVEVEERRQAQEGFRREALARKEAEFELQRSEERMRMAMEGAKIGFWDWDVVRDEQVWSDTCKALLGLAPDSCASFQVLMNSVHPDDRKMLRERSNAAVQGQREYVAEFRVVWPDGSVHWRMAKGRAFYDETGRTTRMAGIAMDIDDRKFAEESLHLQAAALEAAANAIVITDVQGKIVWVNQAFVTMTGYNREEVLDQNPSLLKSGEQPASYYANLWSTISSGKVWQGEIVNRRKDGTTYTEEMTITPVTQEFGGETRTHFIAIKQDITEPKLLQQQLQQAQKMEAVGRLAGGVAHDFNNMVGVIMGYSELLKLRGDLDTTSLHQVQQIHAAAKRAAGLTQQLLAFSRKQIIQPRTLELNEVVSNLAKMLRRLIGDDIELLMRFASSEVPVRADQGQIEQIIMNLAVNARDAMPEGGKLILETAVCDLDQSYAIRHKPVIPGRYVRLSVSDTGTGMDQKTMSHIFEPFFTTKELGRGTGLGLSIVYGIVKQSEGYIWVYSEPGHGTTFKIYLPLRSSAIERVPVQSSVQSVRGSETVLLVEDDENLRALMAEFLTGLGYKILQSGSGKAALETLTSQSSTVQALITDIMMPGMSGRDLANQLTAQLPKLRVLYISGYTHDGAVQTRILGEGESFLQKPFGLAELSRKLREVIETPEQRARAQASGRQS